MPRFNHEIYRTLSSYRRLNDNMEVILIQYSVFFSQILSEMYKSVLTK